jgi:diaminopimelate epimerase
MHIQFTKMHGLGNDFVVVDATQIPISLTPSQIRQLSDRRTGIGFDQLLLIEPSTDKTHDFIYRIYNADGNQVEQCGNGARCVGRYIFNEKLSSKDKLLLQTVAGPLEVKQELDGSITVDMGKPNFVPEKIPFCTNNESSEYHLSVAGHEITFGAVSLGNPHAIIKVQNVSKAPVAELGEALQRHPAFPKQVNVSFMQISSQNAIDLRVFERGVGETRACGSGACAAVVMGQLWGDLGKDVIVTLPGGMVKVARPKSEGNVYLTGPAEYVFRGELKLI